LELCAGQRGKSGQWIGTSWNIFFNLANVPKNGTATLRLAIAAAHRALLRVLVNGQQVADLHLDLDNAMIHGQYAEEDVAFDAALLKAGANTVALEQHRGGNNLFNVMYDCVRLELDETAPFNQTKQPSSHEPKPAPLASASGNDAEE
jgi:rhamnogalacturonan endolyase